MVLSGMEGNGERVEEEESETIFFLMLLLGRMRDNKFESRERVEKLKRQKAKSIGFENSFVAEFTC